MIYILFITFITLYLILLYFRIDEYGVPYLQFFLKQCNTLTSLDVSNNKLGDFQCADIFQCFARPPLDFDDGDGELAVCVCLCLSVGVLSYTLNVMILILWLLFIILLCYDLLVFIIIIIIILL